MSQGGGGVIKVPNTCHVLIEWPAKKKMAQTFFIQKLFFSLKKIQLFYHDHKNTL